MQSKKISKTAENYIEAILTKLETENIQFTNKSLNNTYSYTRQIEEKNAKGSRSRLNQEEEASNNPSRRRYKKITQADLIGKTAGRWTRQEHLRFIQGTSRFSNFNPP